jgi:hypothetical protein
VVEFFDPFKSFETNFIMLPTFIPSLLPSSRSRRIAATGAALVLSCVWASSLRALPLNLAVGLDGLTRDFRGARAGGAKYLTHDQFDKLAKDHPLARFDDKNRVQVELTLDGTKKMQEVIDACEAAGCTITAKIDWYHQGVFSMWMPLGATANLARTAGVNNIKLSLKPKHLAGHSSPSGYGLVPGTGAAVLNCPQVIAEGYTGAGITVGAQSDSYNGLTTKYPVHAAQDVASGDLPGTGNPDNYTTPVNVLVDLTAGAGGEDEGRAMLQIVHDCAPGAALAFATADVSEAGFAANITALAGSPGSKYTIPNFPSGTKSVSGAGCQVLCDDVSYYDEPMFSDGVVAQAIDKATATGAVYFSSAGNDGNSGYTATYAPVTNNSASQALLLSEGGISYSALTTAGETSIESYHSFGTNAAGQPILVQKVLIPLENSTAGDYPGQLVFQWNDPDAVVTGGVNQVSTDYDILVFSVAGSTGTYSSTLSGTASNFSTNMPEEIPTAQMSPGTQYEMVIVRTSRTPNAGGPTLNSAGQIRWTIRTDAEQLIGDFLTPANSNTYGHSCATTCAGTAAYIYDENYSYLDTTYIPLIEEFSSNGFPQFYFDSKGNRLSTPVSRKQPLLATIDGVSTTFFPPAKGTKAPGPTNPSANDSDGDGYPNFFGTSAAGPHAAGCAALIWSAANAKGISLIPADIQTLMVETTQGQSDQDPGVSNATAGSTTFNARDRGTFSDPQAYTITYNGAAGTTLNTLVFDLTPLNGFFLTGNYPVTVGASASGTTGGTAPTIASSTVTAANGSAGSTTLTLTLANFVPGSTLSFGVAEALQLSAAAGGGYYARGDYLAGATVTATDSTATSASGTLANTYSKKWNYKSGYGLVDVNAAVNRLLGH